MTVRNLDRLLIRPYEKKSAALHVEQTVQSILDKQDVTDEILKKSDIWLDEHFSDTVIGRYKKESRKVQIALGVMGHLAARQAIPRLVDSFESTGSFLISKHISDDFLKKYFPDAKPLWPAARESYRTSYWLIGASNAIQTELKATNHPLLHYFDTANKNQYHTWQAWRNGPGRNRWPVTQSSPTKLLADRFSASIIINTRLCVGIMASKAIHHMLSTNNLHTSSKDLSTITAEAIDTMHRHTSADRHLSWEPDWETQHNALGYDRKSTPTDGAEALLQCPVRKILKPNNYAASIEGALMMQDPDFVQHDFYAMVQ